VEKLNGKGIACRSKAKNIVTGLVLQHKPQRLDPLSVATHYQDYPEISLLDVLCHFVLSYMIRLWRDLVVRASHAD
jgi:hypothetical protein